MCLCRCTCDAEDARGLRASGRGAGVRAKGLARRFGQVRPGGQVRPVSELKGLAEEQLCDRRASPPSATAPRGIRLHCDTSLSRAPVAHGESCLFGWDALGVARIGRDEARCLPGVSQKSEMPPRAGASGVEGGRYQPPTPRTGLAGGRHLAILRQPHGPSPFVATDPAKSRPRRTGESTFSVRQAVRTRRVVATKADASSGCRTGARCLGRLRVKGQWALGTWSR